MKMSSIRIAFFLLCFFLAASNVYAERYCVDMMLTGSYSGDAIILRDEGGVLYELKRGVISASTFETVGVALINQPQNNKCVYASFSAEPISGQYSIEGRLIEYSVNQLNLIITKADEKVFRRGDVNRDGVVDSRDGSLIANYVYYGKIPSGAAHCLDAFDFNDNGRVEYSDSIVGATSYPDFAPDLTEDNLDCQVY